MSKRRIAQVKVFGTGYWGLAALYRQYPMSNTQSPITYSKKPSASSAVSIPSSV